MCRPTEPTPRTSFRRTSSGTFSDGVFAGSMPHLLEEAPESADRGPLHAPVRDGALLGPLQVAGRIDRDLHLAHRQLHIIVREVHELPALLRLHDLVLDVELGLDEAISDP